MSDSLEERIFDTVAVACGAASMCWDPRPSSQVFQSREAAEIVNRAVAKIMAHIEVERMRAR